MTSLFVHPRRLAYLLSNGLHPFVITTLTVPLVVLFSGNSPANAVLWTSLFVGLVITPALFLLLYQVRIRHVESFDVAVRRQRTIFFALGISGLFLLMTTMHLLDASHILRASVYAAIATNVIAATVNHLMTKISVHAAAMAGCAAVLGLVVVDAAPWPLSGIVGIVLVGLTALQGWSRVYLGKHTAGQVLLGWVAAVACVGFMILGATE